MQPSVFLYLFTKLSGSALLRMDFAGAACCDFRSFFAENFFFVFGLIRVPLLRDLFFTIWRRFSREKPEFCAFFRTSLFVQFLAPNPNDAKSAENAWVTRGEHHWDLGRGASLGFGAATSPATSKF